MQEAAFDAVAGGHGSAVLLGCHARFVKANTAGKVPARWISSSLDRDEGKKDLLAR